MRWIYSIIVFILFQSASAKEAFLKDIDSIKKSLDIYLVDTHLKVPHEFQIPIESFAIFAPLNLESSFLDACEKEERKFFPYEVILVFEDKKYDIYPTPKELREAASGGPKDQNYYLFLLKYEKQLLDSNPDIDDRFIHVHFPNEVLTEQIKFQNSFAKFTYSTGFKRNFNLVPFISPNQNSKDLYWIKEAEVILDVSPEVLFKGNLKTEEEIHSSTENKSEELTLENLKSFFDLQGLKFETTSVNASLGTEASINSQIKISVSMLVDSGPETQKKRAGIVSSIDFIIPDGSKLIIFSSFKAPVSSVLSGKANFETDNSVGGAAGIEYETSSGIKFRTGVQGIGSENPFVNTGIVIPSGKPPKK